MLGAFNILKPTGWTSSDVVVKVRSALRTFYNEKNIKVGHLGTLDPAGSGVLPIVFGKATRLFDYYQFGNKLYRSTFTFGKVTDTLDSYGQVVGISEKIPALDEINTKINRYIGEIDQLPPKFSRISVGGVRACDASRRGQDIDLTTRKVTVFSIDIISYESGVLTLDIACSGGTYIRSLCRDLAEDVGSLAYMSSIIRLENKSFMIEDSITLDSLFNDIESNIISIDELLKDERFVNIDMQTGFKILNGLDIASIGILGDYVLTIEGKLFGICRDENNIVKVVIRLWE